MTYNFSNTWFINSEIKQFIFNFVNPNNINKMLEIGSYEGASACFFSDFLLNHDESKLVCVDPFSLDDTTAPVKINTKNIFLDNISKSKNFNKIIFKEMYSIDFYNSNNNKFNFIYIDGSHTPEGVTIDFTNCINIIENNGIIWIDDYLFGDDKHEPIKKSIDDIYNNNKDKLEIIFKSYQIVFRKI